jgi:hypothetical protein
VQQATFEFTDWAALAEAAVASGDYVPRAGTPDRDWRAEAALTRALAKLADGLAEALGAPERWASWQGLRRRYRDLFDAWRDPLPHDWFRAQLREAAGLIVFRTAVAMWLEVQGWISPRLQGDGAARRREFARTVNRQDAAGYLAGDVLPHSPLFGDFWTSWVGPYVYGPAARAADAEILLDFWASRPLPTSFATPGDSWYLGDLYQAMACGTSKATALCQTPGFIVDFILDRTLDPAVAEFGLEGFRCIDPCCGTGHFLVAMFHRLAAAWEAKAPAMPAVDRAVRALESVHGVDINPFNVDLARWRLKTAALTYCGLVGPETYAAPPAWVGVVDRQVAWGDSLLPADDELQPFRLDVHDAHLGPTRDEPR